MLGENFQPLDIMLGRNPLMGIFLSTIYFSVSSSFKNETDITSIVSFLVSSSLKNEEKPTSSLLTF